VQPHEQWLDSAEDDLSFAQLGFREKYFSQACFLSQQVVEKSLKGFLLAKGRTYPRLHKVIELAKLCNEIAADLEPLKDDLKLIDEFYIPTRYPDAVPGGLAEGLPGPDEARSALETAAKILQLIRSRI
jgi:HEPN domain-containing protein